MSASRGRDQAMDAMRTLAILLMIASHTTRLIEKEARRAWSDFAMLIEPFTASLFLLLVGASLVHSWQSRAAGGRSAWVAHVARRAGLLWAVSFLFFLLEHGFYPPDVFLSSGILATIAYSMLLYALPVSARRPEIPILALLIAGGAAFVFLDLDHRRIFLLTSGNSPLLPLALFTGIGALGAAYLRRKDDRAVLAFLVLGVLLLGYSLAQHSFEALFTKPVGRYGYARVLAEGLGGGEKRIAYYNLRPAVTPVIAALCALLYAGLHPMRGLLFRLGRPLLSLGRHSLQVYILHLCLLAALVLLLGRTPLVRPWQGDAVALGVTACCYAWALGREALKARKNRPPAALRVPAAAAGSPPSA